MDKLVTLTTASGPLQQTLIGETLRGAGIAFETYEKGFLPSTILGQINPLQEIEFRIPVERQQEAKDLLCANGIVCEISERLLKRSLEEIVKPLLGQRERDLTRLARFVEINNKETVRALFNATSRESGGEDLLEDLFFTMARDGSRALLSLARIVGPGSGDSFRDRFRHEGTGGDKAIRLGLLEVLPEFTTAPWRDEVLRAALDDEDTDIREAAKEAAFFATG